MPDNAQLAGTVTKIAIGSLIAAAFVFVLMLFLAGASLHL
jgi:hypothetical protein